MNQLNFLLFIQASQISHVAAKICPFVMPVVTGGLCWQLPLR